MDRQLEHSQAMILEEVAGSLAALTMATRFLLVNTVSKDLLLAADCKDVLGLRRQDFVGS